MKAASQKFKASIDGGNRFLLKNFFAENKYCVERRTSQTYTLKVLILCWILYLKSYGTIA